MRSTHDHDDRIRYLLTEAAGGGQPIPDKVSYYERYSRKYHFFIRKYEKGFSLLREHISLQREFVSLIPFSPRNNEKGFVLLRQIFPTATYNFSLLRVFFLVITRELQIFSLSRENIFPTLVPLIMSQRQLRAANEETENKQKISKY